MPRSANTRWVYLTQAFLCAAVTLILILTLLRVWVSWTKDAHIGIFGGTVIAIADDLKNGVFYRPLFGPWGYGGTRYFPLYVVLDALLLKLHIPVLLSTYLLSGAAVVLLITGSFYLMRALGVEPWLAACAAVAIMAAESVQGALAFPHPDGLASALNIWGLAVVARLKPTGMRIVLASILFTLAWSAKMTTVFGLAAAVVWLLGKGLQRAAWALAGATCCGYLLVAGAMMLASQGRVLHIFKACSSGEASWRSIASGPLHLLRLGAHDHGPLLFFLLALFALFHLAWSRNLVQNLPALFFVATTAVTTAILGSPGTMGNHLLDVQAAAVILFTVWLANRTSPLQKEFGICVLALVLYVAAVPIWHTLQEDRTTYSHPHRFQRVIALVENTHKPLLTENPVIAVLAGQHPYVLDPWMLRLLQERTPAFGEPLLDGLRKQTFGAVVLSAWADPRTEEGRWWYDKGDFGPGFALALISNYRLSLTVDDQAIWLPKSQNDVVLR